LNERRRNAAVERMRQALADRRRRNREWSHNYIGRLTMAAKHWSDLTECERSEIYEAVVKAAKRLLSDKNNVHAWEALFQAIETLDGYTP